MRYFLVLTGLALLFTLTGCGDYPRGRVHGTVLYQGKPVTHAVITFLTKDNQAYRADIGKDGTYEVPNVVRGPVRVSIQQVAPSVKPRPDPDLKRKGPGVGEAKDDPAARAARDPAPSEPVPMGPMIPTKYADANTSGLSFELTGADQEWSIDLK